MYRRVAPSDLRMPISRVRSITAVYMDWKITRKPMIIATDTTVRMKMLNPGRLSAFIMLRYSSIEMTE